MQFSRAPSWCHQMSMLAWMLSSHACTWRLMHTLRVFLSTDDTEGAHWPLFPGPYPLDRDSPSALGTREDLQALGLVVLELAFAALAEGNNATGPALQRLLVDVFASDITAFRCGW